MQLSDANYKILEKTFGFGRVFETSLSSYSECLDPTAWLRLRAQFARLMRVISDMA